MIGGLLGPYRICILTASASSTIYEYYIEIREEYDKPGNFF